MNLTFKETIQRFFTFINAKKANKVTNATNGHLATLDANGDLVDSGKSIMDMLPEKINVNSSTNSVTLLPNKFYYISQRTNALTISLGSAIADITSEYHLLLITGSSAPTITWNASISWAGDNAPTVLANSKYEISIMNNIATFIEI